MAPTESTTVLDIGVDDVAFGEHAGCRTLNFFEALYPWPQQVTALGVHEGTRFRESYPQARYVQGDALALPFEDDEFDIAFSNAVIEHVGGPEEQRRFVDEASACLAASVRDDAEPVVPGRGAHAASSRPLATRKPLRTVRTTSRASPGRRRTTCSDRASCATSSRARHGS